MSDVLPDYPFESHYEDVDGVNIHYIDEGEGDVILFLHGVPTWSYLWRKIIPTMQSHARCIAPDLVGFGRSDKPEQAYSIFDHIQSITKFIQQLNLKNITLVMHGWGSVIGFHYAMQHPENIKGLAFLESHVRANMDWSMLSLPVQQLAETMLDEPDQGYELLMQSDFFMENIFKQGILKHLSEEEWQAYSEPFGDIGTKKAVWQYIQDLPLREPDKEVLDLISDYSATLKESNHPKLMLYAVPGFITTIETVNWAKNNLSNLTLVDIGDALHYPQETNPEIIGDELQKWFRNLG
jgi:haloalkane dehalogenase